MKAPKRPVPLLPQGSQAPPTGPEPMSGGQGPFAGAHAAGVFVGTANHRQGSRQLWPIGDRVSACRCFFSATSFFLALSTRSHLNCEGVRSHSHVSGRSVGSRTRPLEPSLSRGPADSRPTGHTQSHASALTTERALFLPGNSTGDLTLLLSQFSVLNSAYELSRVWFCDPNLARG